MNAVLRAAVRFGTLVAWGLLARAEVLAHLAETAMRAAPHMDPCGRRLRVAHTLDDATAEARRRSRWAAWRLREALAPLLAAGAPARALIAAGFAAAGDTMPPDAARALIADAVRRELARRARA